MTVVSFIWKFFFFEQGKEVVLESEVQVLSRLRHPNIVKLYDVIDSESTLCLVLELVEVSACARCVNLARPCMNNSLTISRIFFLFFDLSLSLSLLFYHVLFCSILFYSVLFFVSAIYLFVFGFFFFWIVLVSGSDWLKGGDLFDAIAAAGKFSEPEAKRMTQDLASALTYLHSLSIVHRDVKPENLFVRAHCYQF